MPLCQNFWETNVIGLDLKKKKHLSLKSKKSFHNFQITLTLLSKIFLKGDTMIVISVGWALYVYVFYL